MQVPRSHSKTKNQSRYCNNFQHKFYPKRSHKVADKSNKSSKKQTQHDQESQIDDVDIEMKSLMVDLNNCTPNRQASMYHPRNGPPKGNDKLTIEPVSAQGHIDDILSPVTERLDLTPTPQTLAN